MDVILRCPDWTQFQPLELLLNKPLSSLLNKNCRSRFLQASLETNFTPANHSPLTGVGGNHLVTGPNFKMDTEEAPNLAPIAFDESQSMFAAWRCPYRTQFLSYTPKLIASRRLLLSDTPIVDSTVPVYEFDCQSWLGHHFRRLTTIRPQPFSLDIIVSVPLFTTSNYPLQKRFRFFCGSAAICKWKFSPRAVDYF